MNNIEDNKYNAKLLENIEDIKTAGGFIWKYEDIRETSKKNLIQRINELTKQLETEKEKNKKIEDKIKRKIEWYQQYCDLDDQTIRALEDILE